MAEVPVYTAYVTVGDSAKKMSSVEARVSAVDAKAWIAAADQTARDATAVGTLLSAFFTLMMSSQYYAKGVRSEMVNDAFVYPTPDAEAYNSNKLKISYKTSLNGLPRNLEFTIPQREASSYTLESNGINVSLTAQTDIPDLIVQILATMDSLYGTAITAVNEITVNDQ